MTEPGARSPVVSAHPGTPTPSPIERCAALAALYDAHRAHLEARVRRAVCPADPDVVADACASAWLRLVGRPDVSLDRRGLSWLTLVAIQDAWRLTAARRDLAADPDLAAAGARGREPGLESPDDPLDRLLDREAHQERVACFAGLKSRERRDLLLSAAGFRYREIAALTGSTYTAVNRRVTEGRARLRRE